MQARCRQDGALGAGGQFHGDKEIATDAVCLMIAPEARKGQQGPERARKG